MWDSSVEFVGRHVDDMHNESSNIAANLRTQANTSGSARVEKAPGKRSLLRNGVKCYSPGQRRAFCETLDLEVLVAGMVVWLAWSVLLRSEVHSGALCRRCQGGNGERLRVETSAYLHAIYVA